VKLMLELIEELEIHKLESRNTNYNPNLILLLRFLLAKTYHKLLYKSPQEKPERP